MSVHSILRQIIRFSGPVAVLHIAAAAYLTLAPALPALPVALPTGPFATSELGAMFGQLNLNPVTAAGLGLAAAWLHLLGRAGYRRYPFWVAFGLGTALLLVSAGFIAMPEAELGFLSTARMLHSGLGLCAALVCFAAARFAMSRVYLKGRAFAGALVVAVALTLSVPRLASSVPFDDALELQYQGEFEHLLSLLHPAYREYDEKEIERYIEEIASDEELSTREQEAMVRRLNERIHYLEGSLARFEELKDERDLQAEEIARLNSHMEELRRSSGIDPEDLKRVSGYREAVRPAVPLVRDFAVGLAAEHPGTFFRSPGSAMPSREGLLQVLAIHRHVFGNWRYVNDPQVIRGNYYSPADRTIAVGLIGDCDDFATLIASAVEAVGGRARIVHGVCAEGGHAWPELYIGNAAAWNETLRVLGQRFPGRRISHIRPQNPNDYWLSLDWQVGVFSCGSNPVVAYQSPR
ncbi:MAG: hypothetical protein EA428_08275 [Spirochaetaceae bacterium]|nr:MAG: hypothetical protein EA428_08275 [Spirochaetaceae bacterium]